MEQAIGALIHQHAQESAFLWLLRDEATASPHYLLRQVAELDQRVEAHLDGLRIAGGPAWELCEEQLVPKGAGEIFAGAALAFETEDNQRLTDLLKAASKSVQLSRGLISALGWLAGDSLIFGGSCNHRNRWAGGWVSRLLQSSDTTPDHRWPKRCAITMRC